MKTVLYNKVTNEVIGTFPFGYLVNGKPSPTNDPDVVELVVIETAAPEHNNSTQNISSQFVVDLVANSYTQVWEVVNKTVYEIAMEGWQYPQFAKRIIAPVDLVMQYPQVETWFRINDLPIVRELTTLYCYCNVILAAHQQLIDALQGVITVEDLPTE